MLRVLLKNVANEENITIQQNAILNHAKKYRLNIDSIEIETSDSSKKLDERLELKAFLRGMAKFDTLIIYDFWVLTRNVGELCEMFKCMMTRNITLHVVNKKLTISSSTNALELISILVSQVKEAKKIAHGVTQGRPKGRMSMSKFDKHRVLIIAKLEQGLSVSKIASMLGVSRSSLKDYVNSRNLKALVDTKKNLLSDEKNAIIPHSKISKEKLECDLLIENKK